MAHIGEEDKEISEQRFNLYGRSRAMGIVYLILLCISSLDNSLWV
jgi:hypothetical protein